MPTTSFEPPVELCTSAFKRSCFAAESYFQEVFHELLAIEDAPDWRAVGRKSFVLFKTDAGAVRCVEAVLDILEHYGIRALYAIPLQFHRHTIREIWRYELNVSTYSRYPAVDALLTWAPSLFVTVQATPRYPVSQPLCVTLAGLKGPSSSQARKPHHIRYRIGALDGMFNHIHTPDEPIDMLREIGVLFDRHERRPIIDWLAGRQAQQDSGLSEAIREFYENVPEHSLSLQSVLEKICAQGVGDAQCIADRARSSHCIEEFRLWAKGRGVQLSYWDAVVLFITDRPCSHAGISPLLEAGRQDECHG